MCGVFGFAATGETGPNLRLLRCIARETQTRGRDAFGLAYVEHGANEIETFKAPGDADEHIERLGDVANARILIGHCRYATHGAPDVNDNNHPHAIRGGKGSGWLVHNGVVRNYREIVRAFGARMKTDCDTESLAIALGKLNGSISRRLAKMASLTIGNLAVLSISPDAAGRLRFGAVRRGNPLHYVVGRDGIYFASLPGALSYARVFPDGKSWEIDGENNRIVGEVASAL